MNDDNTYLRVGAGTMIHKDGKILVFKRADHPSPDRQTWQIPQGGIDQGESMEDGMWRELYEETALQQPDFDDVHIYPHWTVYIYDEVSQSSLAQRGIFNIGQSHRWWFLKIKDDVEIHLGDAKDKEFVDYRWVDPSELIDMTVDFKHETYNSLLRYFQNHIK